MRGIKNNMAVVRHRFRAFYNFLPFISPESLIRCRTGCLRGLRTSSVAFGLEEFFPPGVVEKGELAPESVNTGRKWRAGELRGKSNEDLHKLWYVLLKERNMLLTLRHEAKRQGVPMPSPTRLHKVQKSMAAIKTVIGEREKIVKTLEKETWPFDRVEDEEPLNALEEASDGETNVTNEQPKPGFFNKLKQNIFPGIWRTA